MEAVYRFLDNFPYLIDAINERGKIVYWNKMAESLTGYHAERMQNEPEPWELLYPDTGYREQRFTEAALKMWKLEGDLFHITTAQNKRVPIWISLVPVKSLFNELGAVKIGIGVSTKPPIGPVIKKLHFEERNEIGKFSFCDKSMPLPYEQEKLSMFFAERIASLDAFLCRQTSGKEFLYHFNR